MTRILFALCLAYLAIGCLTIPCSDINGTFVALTERYLAADAAAACANLSLELAAVGEEDFRNAVNTSYWCNSNQSSQVWIASWSGDNYSLPAVLLFTGEDPAVGGSIYASQDNNETQAVLCKRTDVQAQLVIEAPAECENTVINFDDLETLVLSDGTNDTSPFILNGYKNLNWENILSIDYRNFREAIINATGYQNATTSGSRVAANAADVTSYATPGIISVDNSSFSLISAQVGIAFGSNGGRTVVFTAFRNGSFIDSYAALALQTGSLFAEFPASFHNVDKIEFMDVTSGANVVLDDVRVCTINNMLNSTMANDTLVMDNATNLTVTGLVSP